MSAREGKLNLDQLKFAAYWPAGSEEIVREFLKSLDPATMPHLHVAEVEGEYHLIGWDAEPGLLEAARGWALTEDEERWVRIWPDVSPFGIGGAS